MVYCLKMLFCVVGLLGSTISYEKGSSVCLSFGINQSTAYFTIRRNGVNLCSRISGSTPSYPNSWRNVTCNISEMFMSVCFEDSKSEDAGLFSLYDSASQTAIEWEKITLQITSMQFSIYNIIHFWKITSIKNLLLNFNVAVYLNFNNLLHDLIRFLLELQFSTLFCVQFIIMLVNCTISRLFTLL